MGRDATSPQWDEPPGFECCDSQGATSSALALGMPAGSVHAGGDARHGGLAPADDGKGDFSRIDSVGSVVLARSASATPSSFARYGPRTGPRLAHSSACGCICFAITSLPTESVRFRRRRFPCPDACGGLAAPHGSAFRACPVNRSGSRKSSRCVPGCADPGRRYTPWLPRTREIAGLRDGRIAAWGARTPSLTLSPIGGYPPNL